MVGDREAIPIYLSLHSPRIIGSSPGSGWQGSLWASIPRMVFDPCSRNLSCAVRKRSQIWIPLDVAFRTPTQGIPQPLPTPGFVVWVFAVRRGVRCARYEGSDHFPRPSTVTGHPHVAAIFVCLLAKGRRIAIWPNSRQSSSAGFVVGLTCLVHQLKPPVPRRAGIVGKLNSNSGRRDVPLVSGHDARADERRRRCDGGDQNLLYHDSSLLSDFNCY